MVEEGVDQRAGRISRSRMNDHPRWLVNDDHGGIFIEDSEGKRFRFQRKGFGPGESDRNEVSCFQVDTGFGGSLIQKNIILLDQSFGLRTGKVKVGFRKELVKTSSLTLFRYPNRKGLTSIVFFRQIDHST
jgi:hypothetical protein